jgi:transcriptional regulator with GAF, ATPase, and Fis domain
MTKTPKDTLGERLDRLMVAMPENETPWFARFVETWEKAGTLGFFPAMAQENQWLQEILHINKALSAQRDITSLLTLILDKAIALTRAERGFIIMAPDGKIVAARNFDQEWVSDPQLKVSHTLAQRVMQGGRSVVTANAQKEPDLARGGSIKSLALQSVVCVPMVVHGETLGVVYLDNRFCEGAFATPSLSLVETFAEQAALAVQSTRLFTSLEARRAEMEKWSARLNMKEPDNMAALRERVSCLEQDEENLGGVYRLGQMISESHVMRELFRLARLAAMSQATVLIMGESGTGKGLLARAIHDGGIREGPFVAENCAALAETLLESELFGYVRGAFTGATSDHEGLFDVAHGGSLFLDEVGDMPLAMQAKLLRVLEEGEIRPVGSARWHSVDVRIIAATHRDVQQMVSENKFREDLWYRLRVISLTLPPLRDHAEDIPLLVQHFLATQSEALAKEIREIEPAAMEMLMNYQWPGNIRQLEHEIRRIVALKNRGGKIHIGDLHAEITHKEYLYIAPRLSLKEAVARFEYNYIVQTLRDTGGNKSEAAKILGVSRRSLYNKWQEK